ELGEIENRLLKHPEIKQAVVIVKTGETTGKYLCAYIVSDHTLESTEMREYLLRDLPDYMIPAYFVNIPHIPLTANGKVDKKTLPEPGIAAGVAAYTAPRNAMEKRLTAIWTGVLDVEEKNIGIDTDFFQLGGHSLKATIVSAAVHKDFDVKMPLVEIFKTPTIRGIAGYIKRVMGKAGQVRYEAIKKTETKKYYPLSAAQKRLYLLQQMDTASVVYNIDNHMILEGPFDLEKLKKGFE
ncbi:MAG: hypothetical protein GY757_60520, partial [bacterium]|nr:hypothetical protein [bacterium]